MSAHKRKWQSNNNKSSIPSALAGTSMVQKCVRLTVSAPVLLYGNVCVCVCVHVRGEGDYELLAAANTVVITGASIVCLIYNMQTTTNNFSYYKLNITQEVSWEGGREQWRTLTGTTAPTPGQLVHGLLFTVTDKGKPTACTAVEPDGRKGRAAMAPGN